MQEGEASSISHSDRRDKETVNVEKKKGEELEDEEEEEEGIASVTENWPVVRGEGVSFSTY